MGVPLTHAHHVSTAASRYARLAPLAAGLVLAFTADTRAGNVTTGETFDAWSGATTWGTWTNDTGWVLSNGKVCTSFHWHAPSSSPMAAWFAGVAAGSNTWLRSPLQPLGANRIEFVHARHGAMTYTGPAENLLAIETSSDGQSWTARGSVTNASNDWHAAMVELNCAAPVYVRIRKIGDWLVDGIELYAGLDDIAIHPPPLAVLGATRTIPAAPTVADAIDIAVELTSVHPAATDLTVLLHYRYDVAGPYQSRDMTPVSETEYRTAQPLTAGHAGTVEYYISASSEIVPGEPGAALFAPEGGAAAPARFTIDGPAPTPPERGQTGPSTHRTDLTITEIMYHPAARTDGRDRAFVEIFNSAPVHHDIGGYRLSGDIDYTFPEGTVVPPRSYVLVGADPAVLALENPVSYILGPYAGALDHGGGTVRLRNHTDALLLDVTYDDEAPWPIAADGAGHSLVLGACDYGQGDPRAWRASYTAGGSPGTADAPPVPAPPNVVINEFLAHTDLPQTDFIELYNRGTTPVDLSGFVLTDDPAAARCTLPAGTTLAAGGFAVFDQAALGFSLSKHGDDIFLVDTNGPRVIDAVRFPAQVNGSATGRHPDGSPYWRVLAAPTPGAHNAAPAPRDIVINEIMYHPLSGDTRDEYIELYNAGATAVDLSYWRFTKGVDQVIPPGTTLAPGEFLVVANDADHLRATYPQLTAANTIGNYAGSLSDRGERVVLAKPEDPAFPFEDYVTMDELEYGDGEDWGRWTDGGGSSLELVNPHADNALAMNWRGSDETAAAPWTEIDYTGSIDNGKSIASEFRAFLLQAGECLLDDVVIGIVNGATLLNEDFESGQGSWRFWGTHVRTSYETGTGYGGGNCLHIRASARGDNGTDPGWSTDPFQNRVTAPLLSVPPANTRVNIRARVRWLAGWPHAALALSGFWLEAPVAMQTPPAPGTPGLSNSRRADNVGPAIYDLHHAPVLPAAGEPVIVTCRADDADGIAALTLHYRLDPSATVTSIALRDDGGGGDALAADGLFSATIPGQPLGQLVAFTVEADDGATPAATTRYPAPPTTGAPPRECLVRFGHTAPSGALPSYHLWITAANVSRWQTICGSVSKFSNEPIDITLVYDGRRVIYEAGARFRGLWRNYGSPESSGAYSIEFGESSRLLGGREIKLDQPGQTGADTTLQKENYGFWLARAVDIPGCHVGFVHVTCNGTYRGIRHDLQTPALDFCQSWFNDDAPSVFKDIGWTDDPFGIYTDAFGRKKQSHYRWNLRKRKPDPPDDDFSPVYAVADAFATTDDEAYIARVGALVDVRGWLSYFALNGVMTGWDAYGYSWCHNMYAYIPRHRGASLFVYDLDHALAGAADSAILPSDANKWPVAVRFCRHPAVRRAYWQFVKELVDGPMTAERTEAWFDDWYNAFRAEGASPVSPDGLKNWVASRRAYVAGQVALHEAPFAITTNGGADFSTTETRVSLTGTAPLAAHTFRLNGESFHVTFTSDTSWRLTTGLRLGANSLHVEAFDRHGQAVDDASIVVTTTTPPPVPADALVINEIMYNPAAPLAEFVEIHNLSPTETYDLSGFRIDGIDGVFPAGTFIGPTGYVVMAENLAGYQAAYKNAEVVAGVYAGTLDNGGETVRLLAPAENGASWTVLDEVRYDDDPPWPVAADGTGASLQLSDPSRDNARIGNWTVAPRHPSPAWTRVAVTGSTSTDASRMPYASAHLFLNAPGAVTIDDVCLVAGTQPETGANLLANGGFETTLSGPWTLTREHAISAATNAPVHSGASSLRLASTAPGNAGARFPSSVAQSATALQPATVYTLSFWYYPTDTPLDMTAVLTESDLLVVTNVELNATVELPVSTPGVSNNVRAAIPPLPAVWINEVMPRNVGYLPNELGRCEPWIELHNAGAAAADLAGTFSLSNDPTTPGAWTFPVGTPLLPAGGYLLVWADARDDLPTGDAVHAGFRLDPTNGAVVLAWNDGGGRTIVLDALEYNNLAANSSLGAYPEGQTGARLVMYTPTPAGPNTTAAQAAAVRINEWMADNKATQPDPADTDFDDWFELYNTAPYPADISGYFLTDATNDPTQYPIPGGTIIPPHGFLLVWADGETKQNVPGADLHAGFKLDKDGEAIALYTPGGACVDAVAFGPQAPDAAEGRWPDGENAIHVMAPPTPGAANRIFRLSAIAGSQGTSGGTLRWCAEPGRIYRIEYATTLTPPDWRPLGVATTEQLTGTVAAPVGSPPHGYYRLVRQP